METTSTPKNFFLQAGIIVSLYASIVSFLSFVFDLINKIYPPENSYYFYNDSYSNGMRFAISTLIVMFPLFIFLSRLHRKNVIAEPALKESKIRKWLLFFTLFLSGLTMAVDLIVLINTFLQGTDITAAFILKVLAVFVVALAVFFFYLKDIHGYWEANTSKAKMAAWTICAVILAVVVTGFVVIGSPANQQKLTRDQKRVQDLSTIQWQIVQHYQSKGVLPENLEDLTDSISGFSAPKDPKTKENYTYKKNADLSFSLCASFELKSTATTQQSLAYPVDYMGDTKASWEHEAGQSCFVRTIDPERYPVIKK